MAFNVADAGVISMLAGTGAGGGGGDGGLVGLSLPQVESTNRDAGSNAMHTSLRHKRVMTILSEGTMWDYTYTPI